MATDWFNIAPEEALARLDVDPGTGLSSEEAEKRLAHYGPNLIAGEPPASTWQIALRQAADPMNIMLIVVAVVSLFINQLSVGVMVGLLVILNVVLGTNQELKANASVDALAKLQIPQARITRDGGLVQVEATALVPGDIVWVEAGDLVPADGRLLRSATLETQEAALTGESAPIAKDPGVLADPHTALGDQTNLLFQNTQVTRGTATMVVTETGMNTQMGRIAAMLSAVEPAKSPLQRELNALTKVLGYIAWGAVAVIVAIGVARGQALGSVILLGIAMAVSAIPTGLPTFVQAILAYGSKQLAEHRAVVKGLTDVETLGATSAINSDKTGTLTMNEMTVESLYFTQQWFSVSGSGYAKAGDIRAAAGTPVPDFTLLAYGLCLCSDATVSDTGAVIGDPTEAALVVLAAKMGVDAELTRQRYPRTAEVPFDSDYKFMATFHQLPVQGTDRFVGLVKGGPDVVLARCGWAASPSGPVPIDQQREQILAANAALSKQGLRVLAFGYRLLDGAEEAVGADPMAAVTDIVFSGLVGIIDPLRPSSVAAVRTAAEAGIEVRMITGDHAITAAAIGAQLGLGPGAASGAEIQAMTDAELRAALPGLHVFGRVTPQDKLRLTRLMQADGAIVAMTGDAVNDAAALKQADIGVAMGSGSEVTKQAAKMILTDDNFGTLVTAIRMGRSIYDKILSYVRYQMGQLLSLVLLFAVASIFNINQGIPLTPMMVLFLNFFIVIFPVIVILLDPPPADVMSKPPRDPKLPIANRGSIRLWLFYGVLIFAVTLVPYLLYPAPASPTVANLPMTMAFVISALAAVFGGVAMRRDPGSGFTAPILPAVRWLSIPVVLTVFCVEWSFLQGLLDTVGLNSGQWLLSVGLAALVPLLIEAEKWLRRKRSGRA